MILKSTYHPSRYAGVQQLHGSYRLVAIRSLLRVCISDGSHWLMCYSMYSRRTGIHSAHDGNAACGEMAKK